MRNGNDILAQRKYLDLAQARSLAAMVANGTALLFDQVGIRILADGDQATARRLKKVVDVAAILFGEQGILFGRNLLCAPPAVEITSMRTFCTMAPSMPSATLRCGVSSKVNSRWPDRLRTSPTREKISPARPEATKPSDVRRETGEKGPPHLRLQSE